MSIQNLKILMDEAEAAAIHRERARLGVEAARLALEAAKSAVDEARARDMDARAREDEIVGRAEAEGAPRRAFKQAIDERVAALVGNGFLQMTPLGASEENVVVETARAPKAPRAPRRTAEVHVQPAAVPAPAEASAQAATTASEPGVGDTATVAEIRTLHEDSQEASFGTRSPEATSQAVVMAEPQPDSVETEVPVADVTTSQAPDEEALNEGAPEEDKAVSPTTAEAAKPESEEPSASAPEVVTQTAAPRKAPAPAFLSRGLGGPTRSASIPVPGLGGGRG